MSVITRENWRERHERLPQCEVDLTLLREAFLRSGRTASEVARALDWTRRSYSRNAAGHRRGPYVVPDGCRVKRALGLKLENQGHGYPTKYRERCSYEMAVRLAHAIGVDPWEVDL